jgi:hypothetical protein
MSYRVVHIAKYDERAYGSNLKRQQAKGSLSDLQMAFCLILSRRRTITTCRDMIRPFMVEPMFRTTL